jgi:transcription elongation GreA/GreB family factor
MNYLKILMVCAFAFLIAGCSVIALKKEDTGKVIARRAMVRSSTAVVAADLVEVTRGDTVDILDSDTAEGEKWLLVRAHDTESTEGWIEARYIMPQDVLAAARKLADEDKDIPAQASGQLRASSNLRLTPDRSIKDNIMMKLESGSSFEIVGWKRVPKPKETETTESDDAPRAGSVQQNNNRSQRDQDSDNQPEETNELWYKVRLPLSVSPAPAGWVYGKQVELSVPSDIIFYRTGREFVAWKRLDDDQSAATATPKDKDAAKEVKPGSWVILEKGSTDEPHTLDEPDFDRVYVLGYDKYRQEHYTAYRSNDLKGYLPLRVEGQGDNKTFTVRIQGDDGQIKDATYTIYRDDRGVLKVTPPGETSKRKR